MRTIFAVFLILGSLNAQAAISVGSQLPTVIIAGDDGGRVDGKPWSSDMITGKIHVLHYVDPDFRNDNEEMVDAIAAADFDKTKYGSIAIINMAATWLPNAILDSSLASKQEKYPHVTYVKDFNKVLVKKWGIEDDNYVVVVFGKDGKVLHHKPGIMKKKDIKELIAMINAHLDDK